MFTLRKIRRLAGVFAAVLVFAQAVYAAEACVHSQVSAADAVNMQDMADCADMKSAASCLAQCSAGDQSAAYSVVTVPDTPLTQVLIASAVVVEPLTPVNYAAPAPACSPPRPIRFCSFLL